MPYLQHVMIESILIVADDIITFSLLGCRLVTSEFYFEFYCDDSITFIIVCYFSMSKNKSKK